MGTTSWPVFSKVFNTSVGITTALKKYYRLGALGLASLASIPIITQLNADLPIVETVIIGYTFNLIFDIYVDNYKPNFSWLVIWLVVFAMIPSILLFIYNNTMDFERRLAYAEKLSDLKDKTAEESLEEVKNQIKNDRDLKDLFRPFPFLAPEKEVLQKINQRIEILIDRDHTIGHSYFIGINTDKALKLAFKDKIITSKILYTCFAQLLRLKAQGHNYVIYALATHCDYLYENNPSWTETQLLSVLNQVENKDKNSSMLFWFGFWGKMQSIPQQPLRKRLKPEIIALCHADNPDLAKLDISIHRYYIANYIAYDWLGMDSNIHNFSNS